MESHLSVSEELKAKLRTLSPEEQSGFVTSLHVPSNVEKISLSELAGLEEGTSGHKSSLDYVCCLLSVPWKAENCPDIDLKAVEKAMGGLPDIEAETNRRISDWLGARLAGSGKRLRVMVVDDEKIALDSMEQALNDEGYDVVIAHNGVEAMERLKETSFDLVLTDLIMGDVDGHDVLKEIRKSCPDTRVIMITGYATVDTAVEAIRMGAFHYIEKPVRIAELKALVRDASGIGPAGPKPVLCLTAADAEKVSVGGIIADAAGRKLIHIQLNETISAADIVGMSREHGGTLPGLIMREMAQAGCLDPLIVLNGIDAVTAETALCLADIMDPVKSRYFCDRYLEVPCDLSGAVFIVTAKNADTIHGPLKGLLEIVGP